MLMPSIFGENLFDDFMDGFPYEMILHSRAFADAGKDPLYGKTCQRI